MNIDFDALKARFAEIWRQFTAGQKAMLGLGAIGIVLAVFFFLSWSSAPTYRPLYSGLEPEDAAEITSELDAMGVPYQLEDAGRTVTVPVDQVHETRIALSAQGLPSLGSPGYELLDDQSITTSEFRQRIDLQRALEGELAETITSLDAVRDATVHLVMPEDDLFTNDEVRPTASVLVTPSMGSLSSGQVQSIVHLVASSVEGLSPAEITVTDNAGNLLNAPGQDGLGANSGEQQMAYELQFEAEIARAIEQDLLAPIVGPGRSRVIVQADLDFDQRESVTETFGSADDAAVITQDSSTEVYEGSDAIVGGVLGVEPDPTVGGGGNQSNTNYEKEDTSTVFGVDKVTEQVTTAPGDVSRISVAVAVDSGADPDLATIETLVAAAAGIQPARGDEIAVQSIAFAPVDDLEEAPGTSASDGGGDMIGTIVRTVGTVLLVLIVLFLAYRSAKRSSLAKYPVALPLPADDDDDDDMLDLDEAELEAGEDYPALSVGGQDSPQLRLQNQIGELIDQQPEDVAAVLRTWLADRRA